MKPTVIIAFFLSVLATIPASAQSLPQTTPASEGISSAQLTRIMALQNQYVKNGQLAGGVILVARHGKVVYYDTFGAMDKASGKPMQKDAIFRIYSMSKPIIAVAALTLYQQGKFSLLDPVSKYIPEFANMKVAIDTKDASGNRMYSLVPAERPITVLDLMRHTSGMSNAGPKDEQGNPILPQLHIQDHTLADGIRLLAGAPLIRQPGTGFDYSPGPDVVGRLIEIWSGKPLDEYLDQTIFKPLHMVDTGFWVPEAKWPRLTTLYDAAPDGSLILTTGQPQDGYKHKPIFESGAGGLVSTTTDYARFAQMLLNNGELDGVRILSPRSVELMTSDMLGDIPVHGPPMLPGYGFGLTVAVNRGPGKTDTIGSAGEFYWEGAAASLFFVDPKEELITVYMIQKRGGIDISRQYKRMLYAALETK